MNKHLQLIALFLVTTLYCQTMALAQSPGVEWSKTFGGTGHENVNNCIPHSDGGYTLLGEYGSTNGDIARIASDSKIGMIKLDSLLAIQSSRVLQVTFDNLRKARSTSDNGFIVTGNKSNDIVIVKLGSQGDTVWTNTIGGTGVDIPHDIIETADGGYIVAGQTASTDGDVKSHYNGGTYDAWIVKLDSFGKIMWEKCYGGSSTAYGGDAATVIRQTPDGGYIFGGSTLSTDGDATGGHGGGFAYGDAWLVKIDALGVKEWHKTLGGSGEDYINNFIVTDDGGYLILATTGSSDGDISSPKGGGGYDVWVVKLNSTRQIEWEYSYGGTGYDYGYDIAQASDGNLFVLSYVNTKSGDIPVNLGQQDSWVIKINSNTGTIIWSKVLGGSLRDELNAIVSVSSDDELVLAGRSSSSDGNITTAKGNYDWWILKLRPCPEQVSVSASVCENDVYDFNGQLLTAAGEYKDTLYTVGGCDSVITLTLSHLPAYTVVRDASVCEGEVYDFYGQSVSESGSYIHILKSVKGCDSTISLRFTVNTLPAPEIVAEENSLSTGSYAQYEWLYNDSPTGSSGAVYQAGQTGYYQVAVTDENGCRDTSGSYFVGIPSTDAFELEGRYLWKFTIPNLGDQVSAQEYYTERIEYSMTGGVYTNAYTMHLESYDAGEGRWIGVGSGGGSIVKDGVYYVLFFRENRGDSVLVYKHECDSREEAYTFTYPAENATSDYGWNWYVRDPGTGLYNLTEPGIVHLYPNPVRSLLEVQHPFSGTVLMRLLDTYGRLIQESAGSGPAQFDMSACSSGVYLLQVYENNVLRYTERILKQ